ncbi:MAG: DUF2087 domain-containing protein [Eubacteriaceae bacterium]
MYDLPIHIMKKGYVEDDDFYICLLCGEKIEKGVIYKVHDNMYEAEKYMKIHIREVHGSVFEYLIGLEKKVTGLSSHQNNLLKLFYEGKKDEEVQKILGIGSKSTVRNHRFVLKEKERQAKIFLILMELIKEKGTTSLRLDKANNGNKSLKDKYEIYKDDYDKILAKYFTQGLNGRIKTFNMKEKNRIVVLKQIIKRFETERRYTEKEVNKILKDVYEDFVTIRRYLIEYGFMERLDDCSEYWISEENNRIVEENKMERKKQLKQQYKDTKIEAGVYQITNISNKKVLIVATPNVKTINGRLMELRGGMHRNKELQDDWNKYGENSFEFDILEILKEPKEGFFDKKDELKKLELKWLNKLLPYGENGYNVESRK